MPTISKVRPPCCLPSAGPAAGQPRAHALVSVSAAGYVVLEDFATQDEVRQLRERAQAIMDARLNNGAAVEEDAAIFSTVNQVPRDFNLRNWAPQPSRCRPCR